MRLIRLALRSAFVLTVLLLTGLTAFAQFHAVLQGTVSDSQGSAVPAAKVTVTDQSTGATRDTVASDSGFYRVDQLPPGHYTVTVSASGFRQSVSKDIVVEAELPRGFDVQLQVGQVTEQVTVVDQNEGLQSEDASVAGTITNAQIERLPEFSRDPYELIRFSPGVNGDGARSGAGLSVGFPNGPSANAGGTSAGPGGSNTAIFQTENQQPISANGQRVTSNDYMVDGVSVNSLQWGGAATLTPSLESVQEITVLASDYDATDGRSSGAHVKVVTKSGSNQFHGGGLFQYQDPGLNAHNKYNGYNASANTFDPTVRDENAYRQFDGNIGGPVIKNHLFFFFNYEGLRDNATTYINNWVETPQFDQLLASYSAGTPVATILTSPGITPRINKVLPTTCATFPTGTCQVVGPNQINIGTPTGAYGTYVDPVTGGGLSTVPEFEYAQIAIPASNKGNQYNARADYTMGQSTFSASVFLTYYDQFSAQGSQQSRPMADSDSNRFSPSAFLSWVMAISPTISNEARFNFTRYAFNQVTSNPQTDFGIPEIEIQNAFPGFGDRIRYGAVQGSGSPGIFAENTYSLRDMATIIHGRHALRFGAEYTKEQDNDNTDIGAARPDYVFQGPWNFATGAPIFQQIVVNPLTGGAPSTARYYRTADYGAFFQDDWKIRPNLTLNLGLRYEYYAPPTEDTGVFGLLANLVPGPGPNGLLNAVGTNPSQMWNTSKHNFGPRLGFAWSPNHFQSKAVVRGGFGIAYDRLDDIAFTNTRNNPPFEANYGICCGTSGSPFDNGQIAFNLGTSKSPLSYPANPALATPINPANNLPVILTGQGAPNVYATPTYMSTPYIYLYSLQMQYSLPKDWIAIVGYQGSSSHKLLRIKQLQYFYPEPNPNVNAVFSFTPDVNANYNALLTELQRRFTHGLGLTVLYTYSRSMDQLSFEGPGFATNQTYPIDLSKEWGPSDYDMTHNLRVVGLWDLPIFRNRHDWIGSILGGWQLNGDFQFHSGFPWTPVTDNTCPVVGVAGNVLCPIRPTGYSGGAGSSQSTDSFKTPATSNFPNGGTSYFQLATTTTPDVIPPPGIGRNSFRGPRFSQFDFSAMKEFGIRESTKIQLRANAYNAFNKLNLQPFVFGSSSTVISYGNNNGVPVPNPQFGVATGGLAGRVVELEGRVIF